MRELNPSVEFANKTGLVYSAVCTLVLLAVGVILFSRIEKTFMDTV